MGWSRFQDGDPTLRCALLWAVPQSLMDIVASGLEHSGLRAREVATPEALRDALFDEPVSVALVYFGRDPRRGEAACRSIRKHPAATKVPIIAIVQERDAAECDLDCGADDYLVEPFTPAELVLRLRLAAWRTDVLPGETLIKIGELTVDPAAMRVRLRGVPVDLTFKEYSLLQYFLQNRGLALRRDQILSAVWGDDYYGGDRTVDIHVRRLRAKLPPLAEQIETVHGVGYRFVGPEGR